MKTTRTTKVTRQMKAKIKNTHPTYTQVGGWGLQPSIVPIGVGDLLLLLLCVCYLVCE